MIKSVLIVHQHLIYGGAEKYTLNLVNALVEKGLDVTLVTGKGPLAQYVSEKVHHYIVPISRKPHVKESSESIILEIAQKHNVQLIHTQCRTSMLNSQLARTELQIPLITHEHHMYNPEEYVVAVDELQKGADKIITIGPYTAKTLLANGLQKSITSIINGINAKNIPAITDEERKVARTSLKLKMSDKVVVCISRLEPGKGIDKLVKAFITVARKVPDAKLLIIGDDTTTKTLSGIRELCKEYKLSKRVFYYPGEYDIRKYHAVADVFCYPALGKGMAVMEAMAAGLPIVGKKTVRKPLVVEDMVNGLMTEPTEKFPIDPEQIAEKLIYLLDRPELSKSMGMQGREKIIKKFTIQRVTNSVIKVYRDTLQNHTMINTINTTVDTLGYDSVSSPNMALK